MNSNRKTTTANALPQLIDLFQPIKLKTMKKILLTLAVAGMTLGASAQEKGRFEVHDLGNFKLHVYYTNDALGDASYIIEGRKELVTME